MKAGTLSPPDSRLLTVVDLCHLFGICQKSVWNWVDRGWLPEPIRLSASVLRWRRADIEELLESRKQRA